MRAFSLSLLVAAAGCGGDPLPAVTASPPLVPVEQGLLRVGGSGAMLPLARALGAAFRSEPGGAGARVLVEESIGSGGGVRATVDGAIDVGLVSRRLNASESRLGLVEVPVALDAVIIAANREVPFDDVDGKTLVALHAGTVRSFSDGSAATVLLRDRGESANGALDAALPGMHAARRRAYELGFRVLYHDDAMATALVLTRGALGVYSLALLRASPLPLKVLAIDGKRPSVEALADGSWKISRPLAFVVRPDRLARAQPFLDFAASPAGRRLAVDAGYLPLPAGAPAAPPPR